MKVVLVMFKDNERRDFPLKGSRAVVGRKLECDLRIPTGDVSREHCELNWKGVTIHVRDLGSSNGTYVNGKRVTESELKAGDRLSVGPVTFLVQLDGEPAKITPFDLQVEFESDQAAAGAAATPKGAKPADKPPVAAPLVDDLDEEDLLELTDEELDLDDIELLDADEDEEDLP